MSLLKFVLSPLFFFLLLLKMITSQETCSSTQCSASEPKIDYPFGLKDRQGEKCTYPGFNIACNSLGKTVLKLPNIAGDFFVESIDYNTKEIKLSDPQSCLPYRYLRSSDGLTNLSPFMGFSSHTYAFYECPRYIINDPVANNVLTYYAFVISCISLGSGGVLIATPASSTDSFQVDANQRFINYGCVLRYSVSIPIPSSAISNIYTYNVAKDSLYLRWTEPNNYPKVPGGLPPPSNGKGDPGEPENNGMKTATTIFIVVAVGITLLVCLSCGPKAGMAVGFDFCDAAQGIQCCFNIYGFIPCTCCCV